MSATAARDGLAQYVDTLANFGVAPAKVVRERGEDFEWRRKPEDVGWGEAKMCYRNAAYLASWGTGDDGYTYVEGYVVTGDLGLPIPHAWVVDAEGRVIDNTLRESDDPCGFCDGEGRRRFCPTGDVEFSPKGPYRDVDQECEECLGEGCEEERCWNCGGAGTSPFERDLDGTIYRGVRVEGDVLRKVLMETGTYGVLEKPLYYELVGFDPSE